MGQQLVERYVPDLKSNPIELAEAIKQYSDTNPDATRKEIAVMYADAGLDFESSYQYVSVLIKVGNWPKDILREAKRKNVSWNRLRELARFQDYDQLREALGIPKVVPIRPNIKTRKISQSQGAPGDTVDTYQGKSRGGLRKIQSLKLNPAKWLLRLVVTLATILLIHSTANALGGGIVGYAKATVIDLAIVAFLMNLPEDVIMKWIFLLSSLALVIASLFILHGGTKVSVAIEKETARSAIFESERAQSGIQSLQRQLNQVLDEVDKLPLSYSTQRAKKREEAKELQTRIDGAAPSESLIAPTMERLETQENTELSLRAVLLLINVVGSLGIRMRKRSDKSIVSS